MNPGPSRSHLRLAGILVGMLIVLGGLAALASGAPRAHSSRAALTLKSRNPTTVRGTGFRPHTRVKVTLMSGAATVRRPLTSSQGTFTTSFSTAIDRCSAWTITASQPGRASVVLHGPKPECAPASTP